MKPPWPRQSNTIVVPGCFVFLHLPHTGGTWICNMLCMYVEDTYPAPVRGHRVLAQTARIEPGLARCAFVRHPYARLESWWCHAKKKPYLEEFKVEIARRIAEHPGYEGQAFAAYCGPPDDPIRYIGRTESIASDLIRFLQEAGAKFDEAAIRQADPIRPARPSVKSVIQSYRPEGAPLFYEANRDAYERFGYPVMP